MVVFKYIYFWFAERFADCLKIRMVYEYVRILLLNLLLDYYKTVYISITFVAKFKHSGQDLIKSI